VVVVGSSSTSSVSQVSDPVSYDYNDYSNYTDIDYDSSSFDSNNFDFKSRMESSVVYFDTFDYNEEGYKVLLKDGQPVAEVSKQVPVIDQDHQDLEDIDYDTFDYDTENNVVLLKHGQPVGKFSL
jgi:ferredoxin